MIQHNNAPAVFKTPAMPPSRKTLMAICVHFALYRPLARIAAIKPSLNAYNWVIYPAL
jgi:hypothetical protein